MVPRLENGTGLRARNSWLAAKFRRRSARYSLYFEGGPCLKMQAAERTTRQLAGTTQFGTGLLLLAVCSLSAGCGHLPNDASLIREFQKHRTAIETLRRELTADSEIGTVYPTELVKRGKINSVRKPLEPSLHRRLIRYSNLMEEAGIGGRVSNECVREPCRNVEFVVSSEGYLDSGSAKGFLYSPTDPTPLLDSLDRPVWPSEMRARRHKTGYRRIDGFWYLFYWE